MCRFRQAIVMVVVSVIATFASAAPPQFTWINQFAGLPEQVLQNAAPSANGFVGSTGTRTQPIKFRAPDGSLECHVLIRYENGQWETTGDVGALDPDSCGFIAGSFPKVNDVTPFGSSICIGGNFTDIGPDDLKYFACYNNAGVWQQIGGPGNGPNGAVNVLAYDGFNVYLGGSFTTVDQGNTSARRIVRTAGSSWERLKSDDAGTSDGVNSTVTAILPTTSFVYAGVGSGVRKWSSGAADKWSDLGSSNTVNPVRDIELNNTLVAATSALATTWGGKAAGAVSDYDAGELEWNAVGSSAGINTGFGALAVASGFFHATGDFTSINPDAKGIARLTFLNEWEPVPDATALGDFPSFTDLLQLDGEICGIQQGMGTGQQFFSRGIACNDGQKWHGLAQGINNEVLDIIRYNGAIVAGGRFSAAGSKLTNFIAEYRNGEWGPLGGGLVFTGATGSNPGDVRAMSAYQGELIVLGLFNQADGNSAPGLARWDGQDWHAVGGGVQSPGDIMLEWNGQLIIYGFAPSGDGPILSWNGTTLSEFPDLPSFAQPTAMTVYKGDLIAAYQSGSFAAIVRWTGTDWETFTGNSILFGGGSIDTMVARDDDLYVGGAFAATQGGQPFAESVAHWNGNSWSAMGEGLQAGFFGVENLIFAGNGIIATGWFDTSGATSLEKLAYFDGQAWFPLGPGLFNDVTGSFGKTLMLDNSTVYVGGKFDQAGNVWSENIGAFTLKLETIFQSGFE